LQINQNEGYLLLNNIHSYAKSSQYETNLAVNR